MQVNAAEAGADLAPWVVNHNYDIILFRPTKADDTSFKHVDACCTSV